MQGPQVGGPHPEGTRPDPPPCPRRPRAHHETGLAPPLLGGERRLRYHLGALHGGGQLPGPSPTYGPIFPARLVLAWSAMDKETALLSSLAPSTSTGPFCGGI